MCAVTGCRQGAPDRDGGPNEDVTRRPNMSIESELPQVARKIIAEPPPIVAPFDTVPSAELAPPTAEQIRRTDAAFSDAGFTDPAFTEATFNDARLTSEEKSAAGLL